MDVQIQSKFNFMKNDFYIVNDYYIKIDGNIYFLYLRVTLFLDLLCFLRQYVRFLPLATLQPRSFLHLFGTMRGRVHKLLAILLYI